jgi:lipoprotein-anchoring transpeptidase ErfK/SrfK
VRLPPPISMFRTGRRAGGILVRSLVVLSAGSVGWVWWQSSEPATKGSARIIQPPAPIVESNGAIIVPVAERDGRRAEPMVLVPVNPPVARPDLRPLVQTNALVPTPVPTKTNLPTRITTATPSISATATNASKSPFDLSILTTQVALARRGFSSGSFDGVAGSQTRAALRAFQQQNHLPATGTANDATLGLLATTEPLFTEYTVTAEDVASLQPLGRSWLAKSQQSTLAYETILELISERTHSNPKLVRWLNPQMDWTKVNVGTVLKTVNAGPVAAETKAAFLRIHLGERKLHAYDSDTNLIAHFPCSIAARVDKRPLGEQLHIAAVAPNPNYTFDPAVFPESAEAQQLGRKLILQPGPNNPVGTVWLSLDKPGYGIHGTPKPEDVGRTESHGCFRLANWNAEHLLRLVNVGTPVFVEP